MQTDRKGSHKAHSQRSSRAGSIKVSLPDHYESLPTLQQTYITDQQDRRGSGVSSIAPSISTSASVRSVAPKVKIFTPGEGTDYSCEIAFDFQHNNAVVTLREPGPKLHVRQLNCDMFSDNEDKMDFWHYSISDLHPKGDIPYACSADRLPTIDPGRLLYHYKGHVRYLEVFTGPDVPSSKWLIQPLAREKRAAIEKADQEAEARAVAEREAIERAEKEAKEKIKRDGALHLIKLAEEEKLLQSVRLERQAHRKAKAQEEALRRQAALTHRGRPGSTDSSGSTSKNKEARVSVSSLASTQTSSTLPGRAGTGFPPSVQQKKHRLLGRVLFGRATRAS